jgi:HAE1 family hydrophobic/amphiphilic exporter-1
MLLSNVSIKRPVFAAVMMLALLTVGIASYRRLAVDLMPDVELPFLRVLTAYPGAAPETVEREVSKRIEEAVNPIAGVKHVGSISREGVSVVWVQFELEVSAADAAQEARAKVAAIRGELPSDVQEPIVERIDFAALPIVSIAVRSQTLPARELTDIAERRIKRRIERLPGVGKVDLVGASQREIQVEIDPLRLEALGMGVDEVVAGLRGENVDRPLGRVTGNGSEVPLRVQGKARSVEEFRALIVASRSGRPISLGEVALVSDGVEEPRSLALLNGEPAVALDVRKQSRANTVETVEGVRRELEALRGELPPGVGVEVVRDASVFIRESLRDVQQTLVIGGVLTILIVFCFLNSWRSTVITGVTLPISVISAFTVMNFMGMTLNMLTLRALSLAIGLLIDDAIVVRENIVRHLERGEDHFLAAREGTSEIGLAVLATTSSIVAVFLPVAFMKGIIGRFFYDFGITVAFAVSVSLFVSFTLDPMLSSRWIDPDVLRQGERRRLARLLDRFNAWFDRQAERYRALIGWSLDHRNRVLAAAAAAFVLGLGVFGLLEKEFEPSVDRSEFRVDFKTAPDASIGETTDRLRAVLRMLQAFPELELTYATIGAGEAATVRDAGVYVKLRPPEKRRRSQAELQRAVRAGLSEIPGIVPWISEEAGHSDRQPLLVNLRGEDLRQLKRLAAELKDRLANVPGIVDLQMTLEHETPEYQLVVDRERAADAGLRSTQIAETVSLLVGGRAVSSFEDENGEARDVRIRLPAAFRKDPSQVGGLRLAVRSGSGAPTLVPLASVARYRSSAVPTEIHKQDLSREVVVSAGLDGLPLGTAAAIAQREAAALDFPPGYGIALTGMTEIMEESFASMGEALLLAVLFVYLILAAQFESFLDPFAIMLSLPLSIVGMAGLLLATRDTISIFSLIGLIMLMGLVTKNAILLVDFANTLRARGMPRRQALVEAGRIRLRPIVMTTAAMIFGMLPLAFAIGAGAESRAPMARAVIGGLLTSTLLTLIVVPVVYTFLDDLGGFLRRRWRGRSPLTRAAAAVLLATGGTSLAGPARAAEEPLTLTLEQALALAAEKNRDVRKAEEYRRWVRGRYEEERAAALPRLELRGSLGRFHDESQVELFPAEFRDIFPVRQDVRSAELSMQQPLFTWGKVGAAVRAAREGIAFAEDQLDRFRQAVARDVEIAVYDVLVARELAGIAQQNLAQKRRHLEEARRKLSAGTATDYDVLAAQVTLDNARPDAVRAENRVRTARQQLRFLLAEPRDVDVAGSLSAEIGPDPEYLPVLRDALERRPELRELGHQRGILQELVAIARADGRPRLDLFAAAGHRSLGVRDIDSDGKTWSVGVSLSFPFFDGWRTRGRVAQATSEVARVGLEEAKLRDGVAVEVRVSVDAVREAGEIVRGLGGTVAQAERVLFMAEKGYELGVRTRLDVEDAQLAVRQAKAGLARAQRDYRVALVNLRWVSGGLSAPTG